ncbi:MAG: Crp/Fnr family transcriptional regulator [Deltaproteobacteria bacterium]|nr:MAG: Crp/Fnr family transcriptional regulator [Deltaproteobacteria bacterium]
MPDSPQLQPNGGGKGDLLSSLGKDYPKGTILFKEGDLGNEMYIIHKGKVRVTKKVRNVEKTLAILSKGDFFGEMAILNRKPRSATVEVIEDSKFLVVNSETLRTLLKKDDQIAIRLLLKLSSRLQEADDLIENLILKDNESKVANTLINLAVDFGIRRQDGIVIPIDPQNIIPKAGIDVERVKNVLARFGKLGLIKISGKRIVIPDLDILKGFLLFLGKKEDVRSQGDIVP